MKDIINHNVDKLFDLAENSFNEEWFNQIMEAVLEKQLKGNLFLKRVSINFNLSDRFEESKVEKIAIEIPNINIYLEIYFNKKFIGSYSYL